MCLRGQTHRFVMLTSGQAQNKPIQIHTWATIKNPAMHSDIRTMFNRHKWRHYTHTHIMQRLRYKWSCAKLGHSSTQSAGGDGLRFSLTQMCQLLSTLLLPSLGHSEGWTFWMWPCNCNSCFSPRLRGLFMASKELHVHVERTDFWKVRGSTSKCSGVAKTHRLTSCQG